MCLVQASYEQNRVSDAQQQSTHRHRHELISLTPVNTTKLYIELKHRSLNTVSPTTQIAIIAM